MSQHRDDRATMGECRVLFAFDVAQSIDLAGAAHDVHEPTTSGALGRTHAQASTFQFRPPPLRVAQHSSPVEVGRWRAADTLEIVLFDFGAVVVSYSVPFDGTLEEALALACVLAEDASLAQGARHRVDEIVKRIARHLVKPGRTELFEDYATFRFAGRMLGDDAEAFVAANAALLAGILRAESQPLAKSLVSDALNGRLQYSPDDMTLIDWRHAVVFDDEPEDTLRVLEYANVQLLEMRFLDQQLDAALEESTSTVTKRGTRRFFGPFTMHREMRKLSAMQLEAASLFERLGNTLKVSGDPHLARILRQAGTRFRLQEWYDTTQRKLSALDNIYDKLHDHVATVRAEVLETMIILLILVEIVLSLTRHG